MDKVEFKQKIVIPDSRTRVGEECNLVAEEARTILSYDNEPFSGAKICRKLALMFPSRSVDAYKGRRRNPDHQLLVAQAIKRLASTPSLQPSPPAAQPLLAQPDESPFGYIDNDDQPNYSAPVGHISPSQPTKRSSRFNGTQSGVLYPGFPQTLLEHASIDDIPRSSTSVVALSIPSVDELPVPKPVPSRCPSPESRRKTRSHSRQENIVPSITNPSLVYPIGP